MLAFFGGSLRGGFDLVADAVRLRERLRGADLCLASEGRFDDSSLAGKAAVGVARICSELRVPCALIAGQIDEKVKRESDKMFRAVYSLHDVDGPAGLSIAQSIARAAELIEANAATAVRRWSLLARRRDEKM
jgi:glycerate kinase